MRANLHSYYLTAAICALQLTLLLSTLAAQDANFHDAPASSLHLKNPYAGQHAAALVGSKVYATNCASCHGTGGHGTGDIPALSQGPTQSASDGEVFWFITTGSPSKGMPPWASLSEQKRWQLVTYLKSLKNSRSAQNTDSVPVRVKPVETNALTRNQHMQISARMSCGRPSKG